MHLCTKALITITCGADSNGAQYIRIYAGSVVHSPIAFLIYHADDVYLHAEV